MSSKLRIPYSEINVDTPNRSTVLKDIHANISTENILGRGSYGTVVKAIYKGKQAAVKIFDKSSASKMSTIKNEANILGWEHDNIIKIHKVDLNDSYGVVIMERFPGQCLQSILDVTHVPLYHRVLITLDTLNALNFCHSRNLVHLDVKPQNILVAFTGLHKLSAGLKGYTCKLCDFGSSMKVNNNDELRNRPIGTVRYMPPETLKRERISPAADIYSLGITMWQLKSRKYPYDSIERNEIVAYKVVKDDLRPDSECLSKMSQILTPGKHDNCLCEHFYSDLSNQSGGNSSRLANSTKLPGSLSPFKLSQKSRPFMNLNRKLNVCGSEKLRSTLKVSSTDHAKSLTPSKVASTVLIKITDDKGLDIRNNKENSTSPGVEYDLKNVFRVPKSKNKSLLKHPEELYEKLYKKCWNSDPENRISSSELKENLLSILFSLS